MKRIFQNDTFVGIFLALLAFVIYVRTLAPTVDFIDSGELAAVATTLGIAHPTGYPLFTLLGYVFAHLPLGLRTIYQLNLLSAVLCSAAVFFFYRLFLFLLTDEVFSGYSAKKAVGRDRSAKQLSVLLEGRDKQIAAAVGALTLAFSETYWSQALSLEVYSLHILFLSLTIFFFLRAILDKLRSRNSPEGMLSWYAFAFVLGLSFTNHMTTILLAPGFLYMYFATHGFSRTSWMKIGKAAVPFLIGFSVYLYLPLRAAQDPLLNWGNPDTVEKFWWHFTGKQYRVWIFSSFESAAKQFRYFLESYPAEFAYLPIFLAFIGLVSLFRNMRIVFVYTVVLFLGCVLYAINYDIHDIDSYFLLAYIVTAVWIVFGVVTLLPRIKNRYTQVTVGLVLVGLPIYVHYDDVDESKNFVVEDYTMNMFASFAPRALVLSYQWDYFVSASYYYQHVEGVRPDVVVLDKELFRRSWYFQQLERQYPWLIERSRAEVNAFLQELHKFEHGLPYNTALIQGRFEAMIVSFLEKNFDGRPIYVTHEVEPEFTRGFQRTPAGLAFRLSRDTAFVTTTPVRFTLRGFPKSSKYVEMVKTIYASSYTNQAIVANHTGDRDTAINFLKRALEIKPDYRMARNFLESLQRQ
jgi:hypothetical protein